MNPDTILSIAGKTAQAFGFGEEHRRWLIGFARWAHKEILTLREEQTRISARQDEILAILLAKK